MKNKAIEIEAIVKAKGYKLTPSRKRIIQVFVETEEHLKPEEIYQKVRDQKVKDQKIGIATVYRTLDILKRIGIIKELSIQNDRYYELNIFSEKKLHIHFQCNECGHIKEYIDKPLIKEMLYQKDFIEKKYRDCIEDITIVMKGTCEECKQKKK